MIFKEYKKWKESTARGDFRSLLEFAAKDSTVTNSTFPLPDMVTNALNLVSPGFRTTFFRWIFTEGLRQAVVKRRSLVNHVEKETGMEIGQDAIFCKNARKDNPKLAELDDYIQWEWDNIQGEPEEVKVKSKKDARRFSLGEINAILKNQGLQPLHYGGPNGLIEYIEQGSWKKKSWTKKPIMPDSDYDKQGHDCSLSDDPEDTGKYIDLDKNLPVYKFGTSPTGGGFVPNPDPKYWNEFLKEAEKKSQIIVGRIIKDLQAGKSLDRPELAWIKDKMLNNELEINGDSFEDRRQLIKDILGLSQKLKQPEETWSPENVKNLIQDPTINSKDITKRLSTAGIDEKELAITKLSIKEFFKDLFDYPWKDRSLPEGKNLIHGLGPDENGSWPTVTIQGREQEKDSFKYQINPEDLSDPQKREEIAENLASLMVSDDGTIAQLCKVNRHLRNPDGTQGKLVKGAYNNISTSQMLTDRSVRVRRVAQKISQEEEPISIDYNGKKYDLNPEDIVEIYSGFNPSLKGEKVLKKINHRYYKTERQHVSSYKNNRKKIDIDDMEKKGYDIEFIDDQLIRLTKGENVILANQAIDPKTQEKAWFKVRKTKSINKDLPLFPGTLDMSVNTTAGMKDRMFNAKTNAKWWDDFLNNLEEYGDEQSSIEGQPYPQCVAGAVYKLIKSPTNSWLKDYIMDGASYANTELQQNVNQTEFVYGTIEKNSFLKGKLSKAGVSDEDVDEFIELLYRQINEIKKDVVPDDSVGFYEDEEGGHFKVNRAIFDALIENGYSWRFSRATTAARSAMQKLAKDDLATGSRGGKQDEEGERGTDFEDKNIDKEGGYGQNAVDARIDRQSKIDDDDDGWIEYDDEGELVDDDDDDEDEYDQSLEPLSSASPEDTNFVLGNWRGRKRSVDNLSHADQEGERTPSFAGRFKTKNAFDQRRFKLPISKNRPQSPQKAEPKNPFLDLMPEGKPKPKPKSKPKPNPFLDLMPENRSLISYRAWQESEVVFDPKAINKKRTFNVWGSPPETGTIPQKSIDGEANTSKEDPTGSKGIKRGKK